MFFQSELPNLAASAHPKSEFFSCSLQISGVQDTMSRGLQLHCEFITSASAVHLFKVSGKYEHSYHSVDPLVTKQMFIWIWNH